MKLFTIQILSVLVSIGAAIKEFVLFLRLSGFSRLKKFILLTVVNKSKIKEQIRFCYICPNVKAINCKAAKDK